VPIRSLIVAFEYLSDEQARRYGTFVADPSPEELERFFFLNAEALELARMKRRRHNRLGWAVQWGTVRMLGTFLKIPSTCRGWWSTTQPSSWALMTRHA